METSHEFVRGQLRNLHYQKRWQNAEYHLVPSKSRDRFVNKVKHSADVRKRARQKHNTCVQKLVWLMMFSTRRADLINDCKFDQVCHIRVFQLTMPPYTVCHTIDGTDNVACVDMIGRRITSQTLWHTQARAINRKGRRHPICRPRQQQWIQ